MNKLKHGLSLVGVLVALALASFGGAFGGFSTPPGDDDGVTVISTEIDSSDTLESAKGFHW